MQIYHIDYTFKGNKYFASIEAKSLKSAKKKLANKHGKQLGIKYKTGREIKVSYSRIGGYL